jgi:hypothetical protein
MEYEQQVCPASLSSGRKEVRANFNIDFVTELEFKI